MDEDYVNGAWTPIMYIKVGLAGGFMIASVIFGFGLPIIILRRLGGW